MSTESKDARYMRCLKCMQIIKCSRFQSDILVDHVKNNHPEMLNHMNEKINNLHKLAAEHGISRERLSEIGKTTGMSEEEMANQAERYLSKRNNLKGSQSKHTRLETKEPRIVDSKDINRRQHYRTSIQRWMPTDGYIYCPSCGCKRTPLLKSSSEFYASTGCSAACVANCWPFCFLPCFTPVDNREYMHCSNCKCFLGIYDREHNCIRPNREFVMC